MSKKIALATGNRHKLEEVRAILEPLGYEVLSADDFGGIPDVVEDGATFAENSVIKAKSNQVKEDGSDVLKFDISAIADGRASVRATYQGKTKTYLIN